jgi:hypothetical protein
MAEWIRKPLVIGRREMRRISTDTMEHGCFRCVNDVGSKWGETEMSLGEGICHHPAHEGCHFQRLADYIQTSLYDTGLQRTAEVFVAQKFHTRKQCYELKDITCPFRSDFHVNICQT